MINQVSLTDRQTDRQLKEHPLHQNRQLMSSGQHELVACQELLIAKIISTFPDIEMETSSPLHVQQLQKSSWIP